MYPDKGNKMICGSVFYVKKKNFLILRIYDRNEIPENQKKSYQH